MWQAIGRQVRNYHIFIKKQKTNNKSWSVEQVKTSCFCALCNYIQVKRVLYYITFEISHKLQVFFNWGCSKVILLTTLSLYTINWSVISTVLSWVCSSLRACWARLLLPTADACWKLVWMASMRNMSISSMTAAVEDPIYFEEREPKLWVKQCTEQYMQIYIRELLKYL